MAICSVCASEGARVGAMHRYASSITNMRVRVCVYLLRRGLATAKINPINCLQELSSTCFIPFLLIHIHAFWGFFLAFLSFILLFLAYFYIDGTSEIRCRGISSASSFFTFFSFN